MHKKGPKDVPNNEWDSNCSQFGCSLLHVEYSTRIEYSISTVDTFWESISCVKKYRNLQKLAAMSTECSKMKMRKIHHDFERKVLLMEFHEKWPIPYLRCRWVLFEIKFFQKTFPRILLACLMLQNEIDIESCDNDKDICIERFFGTFEKISLNLSSINLLTK